MMSVLHRSRAGGVGYAFALLAVVVAILCASWPQPKLDVEYFTKRAADHVGGGDEGLPLRGVVIVVTGATGGIGKGVCKFLYGLGGTIVAIGRSPSKLAKLKEDLLSSYHDDDEHSERRFVPIVADLRDLTSVAAAADDIIAKFETIDFLVNNAGIHPVTTTHANSQSSQGYDLVFAVNYLSHFLLTEKLLPLMKKKKKKHTPRIVQVSSSLHMSVDGRNLITRGGDPYASQSVNSSVHRRRSYSNSKLAQILHARSLSRSHPNESVDAISVCPGWVGTSIVGKGGFRETLLKFFGYEYDGFGIASILYALFHPAAAGTDEGFNHVANTPLTGGIRPLIRALGYFDDWRIITGFRDGLSAVLMLFVLFAEKFAPGTAFQDSSEESYHEHRQDALFRWSNQAISKFL